ncbi:MAG: MaoC family dehydratase [Nitrosopumilus sp.]|nr:MaoC family dehydratase [Nitrosopumilus sp.]
MLKEQIEKIAELSGDFNPLHVDEEYAKDTKFEKPICHGMMLASFFSRLVGMHIPGKNSLYMSQSLKFFSPCYSGEHIIVEGIVNAKSNATKIITIETNIFKNNKKIITGEAKVMVRK